MIYNTVNSQDYFVIAYNKLISEELAYSWLFPVNFNFLKWDFEFKSSSLYV